MEICPFDPLRIGTGHLFPDSISNRQWIGYHGTASFYSGQIENNGFCAYKVFDDGELDLLIELAHKCRAPAHLIEAADGFLKLKSISFSPLSEVCLTYVCPEKLGGQGINQLRNLFDCLPHDRQQDKLQAMVLKIASIRNSKAVIYAVNLEGVTRLQFQPIAQGVYAYDSIEKTRILARMDIANFTDWGLIDAKKLRSDIDQLYRGRGDHYIKSIAPNPDTDPIPPSEFA